MAGLPNPTDATCPWCDDGELVATLTPSVMPRLGTRPPTITHKTECRDCGAKRSTVVRLDELDAATGSMWSDVPGQTKVGQHEE